MTVIPNGHSTVSTGAIHPMTLDRSLPVGRSETLDHLNAVARKASDLLKALAHESRLLILYILADGERSVTELERMLELRQPTVSQQLARLRAEGLVATRRQGKTIYYSLVSDDARAVIGVIHQVFSSQIAPAQSEH